MIFRKLLYIFFVGGFFYLQSDCVGQTNNLSGDSIIIHQQIEIVKSIMSQFPDSAISICESGISICNKQLSEDNKMMEAWFYNFLGIITSMKGDFTTSIEYYVKSVSLFDSLHIQYPENDFYLQGVVVMAVNIATLYQEQKEYDKALMYYSNALPYLDTEDMEGKRALLLNNIGVIYFFKNEYETALQFYNKALLIFEKIHDEKNIAMCYTNIGETMGYQKKYPQALEYLRSSLKIKKKLDDRFGQEECLKTIADIYLKTKDYLKAIDYANQTLYVAKQTGNTKNIIKLLRILSEGYSQTNQYKEAYLSFVELTNINDSVYNEKSKEKLQELMTKYETTQKELKILAYQEKEKHSEQVQQIMVGAIVLIVFVFIVLIRFLIYKRKQDKKLLQSEIEKKELISNELNKEIQYKTKQLTTHALNMMQKNNILNELQKSLEEIADNAKPEVEDALSILKRKIQSSLKSEKDWDVFKMYFEEIDQGFFIRLQKGYPQLHINDLRHTALIKLNLNIKETASVLNLSPNSIKSARNRLKKKLNLAASDDLFEFIQKV